MENQRSLSTDKQAYVQMLQWLITYIMHSVPNTMMVSENIDSPARTIESWQVYVTQYIIQEFIILDTRAPLKRSMLFITNTNVFFNYM